MNEVLKVEEVARRLGVSAQTIRIRLQRGEYPFGKAFRSNTGAGWRYEIPRRKFEEYVGNESR